MGYSFSSCDSQLDRGPKIKLIDGDAGNLWRHRDGQLRFDVGVDFEVGVEFEVDVEFEVGVESGLWRSWLHALIRDRCIVGSGVDSDGRRSVCGGNSAKTLFGELVEMQ